MDIVIGMLVADEAGAGTVTVVEGGPEAGAEEAGAETEDPGKYGIELKTQISNAGKTKHVNIFSEEEVAAEDEEAEVGVQASAPGALR